MKPIEGFPHYFVSENGSIFSDKPCHRYGSALRQLKQKKNKETGYMQVNIYGESKPRRVDVHRVVAKAFIENDSPLKDQVNHKNGNKDDNRAQNLEWVTQSENVRHAHGIGIMRNCCGRLSDEQAKSIRYLYAAGVCQDRIGAEFGISQPEVSRIVSGRHYRWVA